MEKPNPPAHRRERDTLTLKIGAWFEAQATGWGIIAVPLVLVLLAVVAAIKISAG